MIRFEKQSYGYHVLINKRIVAEIVDVNGIFGFTFLSECLGGQEKRDKIMLRRSSNVKDMFAEVRNAAVVSILESSDDWMKVIGV